MKIKPVITITILVLLVGVLMFLGVSSLSTLDSCESKLDRQPIPGRCSCSLGEVFGIETYVMHCGDGGGEEAPRDPEIHGLNIYGCQLDEVCESETLLASYSDKHLYSTICYKEFIGSENCIRSDRVTFRIECKDGFDLDGESTDNAIDDLGVCVPDSDTIIQQQIDLVGMVINQPLPKEVICASSDTLMRYVYSCDDVSFGEKVIGFFKLLFRGGL